MWRVDWVFSRDGEMIWQCSNCRHIHVGKQAPEMCPVCAPSKAYFQLKAEKLLIETGPGAVKLPVFIYFQKFLHTGRRVCLQKRFGLYIIVMRGKLKELLFCFPY